MSWGGEGLYDLGDGRPAYRWCRPFNEIGGGCSVDMAACVQVIGVLHVSASGLRSYKAHPEIGIRFSPQRYLAWPATKARAASLNICRTHQRAYQSPNTQARRRAAGELGS